ncbi:MAG: hypothetical protein ACPL1Y_04520, partial [Thermoplasmata archaeon]
FLVMSAVNAFHHTESTFRSYGNFKPLTTYHNISVDANLSEWASDENLSGRDNANWYFTWNETNLFVGLSRGETFHGAADNYDVIWVYMDTEVGGTNNSVDWNGRHVLPFSADWCFVFKPTPYGNDSYYWNLRHWNGSDWQIDMNYTGTNSTGAVGWPAWHWDNGIAEFAIPFQDINITNASSIKVVFYLTNGADNWLFGATPTQNPTGGSPQTLIAFWNYTSLQNGTVPNNPNNVVTENTLFLGLVPVVMAVLLGRRRCGRC